MEGADSLGGVREERKGQMIKKCFIYKIADILEMILEYLWSSISLIQSLNKMSPPLSETFVNFFYRYLTLIVNSSQLIFEIIRLKLNRLVRNSLIRWNEIKKHMNAVFIGSENSGKSTLAGHLLYLCGALSQKDQLTWCIIQYSGVSIA